ncbi:MAG: C10 family peptidase [Bacteroidia bacterium]
MKKFLSLAFLLVLGAGALHAKLVPAELAQQVAANYYREHSLTEPSALSLAYTETAPDGLATYYIFNVNQENGFVIVSADDAAHPVIGYSTSSHFTVPPSRSNIAIWLERRSKEMIEIRDKHFAADAEITSEWTSYSDNSGKKLIKPNSINSVGVLPLVQTTWNQSPNYNAMCPGGSVTGCVATAMAQIMRYWNYPAQGQGSSSYNSNFGPLSVNYSGATYNWANMPLYISGNNSDVALINYHAGVSVEMDYSPSGSGAWVCSFDNPVCAQNSYVNYFRYDPSTIQGLDRSMYSDPDWTQLLIADLDNGWPIQYVGWDPSAGGHTWICDGYDQNNNFHMNWGWGGSGNGWYTINSMNPSGMDFSQGHEAVTGIVPMSSVAVDAGAPAIVSPAGMSCAAAINPVNPVIKLENFGNTPLTSCVINYQLDGGPLQTQSWNGTLNSFQSSFVNLPAIPVSAGTHTLTCYTTNPNGSADMNAMNDQSMQVFGVYTSAPAHNTNFVEGFESATFPGTEWDLLNSNGQDWTLTSASAATGTVSAMIDNMSNPAGNVSMLQSNSFDLSAFTSPSLTFKLAYQQRSTANMDKLQVMVSTNCGASWFQRWAKAGTSLSTVSGTGTAPFVPAASDFQTYTVNLVPLSASQNVYFRWVFTADVNGAGNNLYIDDINLVNTNPTGISTTKAEMLRVYPNPAENNLFIESPAKINTLQVIDVLGKTQLSQNYTVEKQVKLDVSSLNPGVYFVKIYSGEEQKLIRFIKQ